MKMEQPRRGTARRRPPSRNHALLWGAARAATSAAPTVIIEKESQRKVAGTFDVAVVGAGPAGFGAAMGAARSGASVALVEQYGFLGGMLTAGYVNGVPWDAMRACAGILKEWNDRLAKVGGIIDAWDKRLDRLRANGTWAGAPFTPTDMEINKIILQKMCTEAGIRLFLHTYFGDAIMDSTAIRGIFVQNKSGRVAIRAKMVIDATGDGDVIAGAGAPFDSTPANRKAETWCYCMGNVDIDRYRVYLTLDPGLKDAAARAEKAGDLRPETGTSTIEWPAGDIPTVERPFMKEEQIIRKRRSMVASWIKWPTWHRKNEVCMVANPCHVDITTEKGLSEGEIKAREYGWELAQFLIKYVPGFEKSYIQDSAPHLGLRESRRVIGEYVVRSEDIAAGRRFDDDIVKSAVWEHPEDVFYLPYRCIVPRKVDNLFASGRCVSLDHRAFNDHVSPRDEATCMVLGQAAGVAAALCIRKKTVPRQLDHVLLRKTLVERHNFPEEIIHKPGLPSLRRLPR